MRAEYQDCRNFWENNEDTSAAAANKWNVRPEQPTSSDLQIEKIKKALSTIYKNTMEQLKALSEDVEIIKRSLAVEEEKEN